MKFTNSKPPTRAALFRLRGVVFLRSLRHFLFDRLFVIGRRFIGSVVVVHALIWAGRALEFGATLTIGRRARRGRRARIAARLLELLDVELTNFVVLVVGLRNADTGRQREKGRAGKRDGFDRHGHVLSLVDRNKS